MSLSKRIVRAREAAGLTQTELARRCGVTRAAVSEWEGGQTPLLGNLKKISRVTKVPLLEIIGGRA